LVFFKLNFCTDLFILKVYF